MVLEGRKESRNAVVFRDRQLVVTRTYQPPGLRLVGLVDATNVEALAGVLEAPFDGEAGDAVIHLDVAHLEFRDVSGIRALVGAAENATGRYRMVLHGLPPLMGRVMDVVGWSQMPSLDISHEAFPHDVEDF